MPSPAPSSWRRFWLALTLCLPGLPLHAAEPPDDADLAAALAQPVYGASRLDAASKRAQDMRTAPGAAAVRTGGEIAAQGYRTLGEVLESLPGVHLRYDRAYSYVGLRGITRPGDYSSRLLVLVDGVRVNDALYESAPMDRDFPIDVSLIDRVEFIPGPGSALYGGNAVAGVVNVITRSPAQLAGGQGSVGIGSHSQRRATAAWGGNWGGQRVLLGLATENRPGTDLHYPEYASPGNPLGTAHGRDGERADKLFAKLQHDELQLSLGLSQRTKGIPTGAYDTAFDTAADWVDRYAMVSVAWRRMLSPESTLELQANHARYAFDSRTENTAGQHLRNGNDARWYGAELRWRHTGWQGHRVTLGLETQRNYRQQITQAVEQVADPDATRLAGHSERHGLYLVDEWTLRPDLLLNLGLRSDRRTDGSHGTTPRLALIWSATPAWTFKWLSGSAYREPNFNELYYEDELQRRPDGLRVESLRSHELVALWRPAPAWQLQGSLHRARMSDVIELVRRDDGLMGFTNRGGVHTLGADLEASWISAGGMQLRGSTSFERAEDAETGQPLSNAPLHLWKLSLTSPTPVAGLGVGLNLLRVGDRRLLQGGSIESYLRVNARLRYAPPGSPWEASLSAYNLLDRRYADPAGPEHQQASLAQDGRSWWLQLGRRF